MRRTREQILEARRLLRAEYGALFDATAELLFRHDPISINFAHNTGEYEPEAETILPRLSKCRSSDDVLRVVHEEFGRWFGTDTAGPTERYAKIAPELWRLWQEHQQNPS